MTRFKHQLDHPLAVIDLTKIIKDPHREERLFIYNKYLEDLNKTVSDKTVGFHKKHLSLGSSIHVYSYLTYIQQNGIPLEQIDWNHNRILSMIKGYPYDINKMNTSEKITEIVNEGIEKTLSEYLQSKEDDIKKFQVTEQTEESQQQKDLLTSDDDDNTLLYLVGGLVFFFTINKIF